jgi:predicted RecB family nuclease
MKIQDGTVRLTATDLSNHLVCAHLTTLNFREVHGIESAPEFRAPDLVVLQHRGLEHEQFYVTHLQTQGLSVFRLEENNGDGEAVASTLRAMAEGIDVIVQGALSDSRWFGRPDVLRKVGIPSELGNWSYEPYDCKLARETKAATILQLSHYAALLTAAQGVEPEMMHVVPPGLDFQSESYRVLDYAAYYRQVKARLEVAATADRETYPEPCEHCNVCRWWPACDRRRRIDDHLSLTAGISRLQRKQLIEWEARTVEQLSRIPLPITNRPRHGAAEGYVRVREQARVQVLGRNQNQPVHELLDVEPARGLTRLPEPSLGDIFFDLESDPFVGKHGIEYLFGYAVQTEDGRLLYDRRWAFSAAEEKAAFEWFVDLIMERWTAYPSMHVYHFGHKEPSSVKALMGRYATREDSIDRMLRAGLFIDLHSVAKQAMRASVEQYSLKALEEFHDFNRSVPLEDARSALRQIEHSLELGRIVDLRADASNTVEGYNADDCFSTFSLRNWLEDLRTSTIASGNDVPRPIVQDGTPSENVGYRQARVAAMIAQLTRDVPADERLRSADQAARWLLANLLDWHRREDKVAYWEMFRLRELDDEELQDERAAIGGLQFTNEIPPQGRGRIPTHEYSFPPQETKLQAGDKVFNSKGQIGTIDFLDVITRRVGLKKSAQTLATHPSAVFSFDLVPSGELADSIFRLAEHVVANGLEADGPYNVCSDLLLRRPPLSSTQGEATSLIQPDESLLEAAKRLVTQLNGSVLPLQGPPGAGKTFTAAHMIIAALRAERRIAVTANSHKVIRKLLEDVQVVAGEEGLGSISSLHKVSKKSDTEIPVWLTETTDNAQALDGLRSGRFRIVAGTAWLWARQEAQGVADLLFVDEAGQISLANAIAVAPAARNLILLGDPQQLDQPLQGSHPDGAELSALEHLLGGAKTVDPRYGLFLDKTWRLHPHICRFTSELFYENRLESREGLENQRIDGHEWLGNAGLRFLPIRHEGNQNTSIEEAEYIASIVEGLLRPEVHWIDSTGNRQRLTPEDILIVAPYNAQVAAVAGRLQQVRVGTVDKFQGQQAPIVIYSLTTSSPQDAPRGMEFLYSLNRLNVATSRAKAMAIVVGSPKLLEPECKTPRQLQLANALCRFVELSGANMGGGMTA